MDDSKIREVIKTSPPVIYPDFDLMWDKIEQSKGKDQYSQTNHMNKRFQRTGIAKAAIITGVSAVLIATPVYAAIHYDWTNILSYRSGIHSLWEQGLGQSIQQSVTKDGLTLTVDTAFTDENRTVLLFTVNPGTTYQNKTLSYDSIELLNSKGESIPGNYYQMWNSEIGEYQGYFETDYVLKNKEEKLKFAIENVVFTEKTEVPVPFDPATSKTQTIDINQDGIKTMTIQSFDQSADKILLRTSFTFEGLSQKQRDRSWTTLYALNANNEQIASSKNVYGTPGTTTEQTISEQTYRKDQLSADGTHFTLSYDRETTRAEGTWEVDMTLSKAKLENSTIKEPLNLPVPELMEGSKISNMIITPSEVRLTVTNKEKYTLLPFLDYELEIAGTRLIGGMSYSETSKLNTELRFEMTQMDLTSIKEHPITLIAKKRVDEHKGDQTAIHLSNISTKPQHLQTDYNGYLVDWTYYLKDEQLYVESSSQNPVFGGMNQTYYYDGKEKMYGKPLIVNFKGEGNKSIDMYEHFTPKDVDIFVFMYRTDHLDETVHIPIELTSK